jgi:hypothetical protein
VATASSQNTSTGQTARKAIDSVVGGYKNGNPANEWASVHEGKSAWLKLTWNNPVIISHVILYDRPNNNDQITAGHLVFDNGTTVSVPLLNNDSTGTEVSFTPISTKTVKLIVDDVKPSTKDIGLAEIQVFK